MTDGTIERWETVEGVRPALLFEEAAGAIEALKAHAGFQAAMAERGITDFDRVQIDPWPTGHFDRPLEEGRRITRCLSYYREEPRTTATPVRSKGCWPRSTRPGARSSRWSTSG